MGYGLVQVVFMKIQIYYKFSEYSFINFSLRTINDRFCAKKNAHLSHHQTIYVRKAWKVTGNIIGPPRRGRGVILCEGGMEL